MYTLGQMKRTFSEPIFPGDQEHWQNEIRYKVHLSTLFPKGNATFHAAFLLKNSVYHVS